MTEGHRTAFLTAAAYVCHCTLPIAKIISAKNARAWVSMVSYLKKELKIKILERKKKFWEPFRICLLNKYSQSSQFPSKLG